ncbi:hypothetical protein E8E13_009145 [Curvularia kusanoi]|uniref:Uncharacterized protein n=1 Tax=Curvularia kusanoi TaxID=90978 RepID=A0A9P4TD31_CURKU|nr:hypothetical protein E8E13_009145 [Curvularia kusanoi]
MPDDNLLLETDAVDSVHHLGLNDGPHFTLHSRMHCAPLKTEGYTLTKAISNESGSQNGTFYFYGFQTEESTFGMKLPRKDYIRIDLPRDYVVESSGFSRNSSEIIPELRQPFASVALHLMDASGVTNLSPTKDPWFSATTPLSQRYVNESDEQEGLSFFASDIPSTPLGCAWQNYLCNPNLPKSRGCITGDGALLDADWTHEAAALSSVWSSPKDQSFIRALTGIMSDNPITKPLLLAKTSLKMRSSNHYSFSAWFLVIVLLFGSIVMLIATFLEEIVGLILKYPRLSSPNLVYAYASWQASSTLQLHRLANENLGLGTWSRTNEAVPVTVLNDTLAVLDVADPRHARMVAPSEELSHLAPSTRQSGIKARATYERVPSNA